MKKTKSTAIEVHGTSVAILSGKDGDYISLTDMLQAKDGEFFISDWLRNRNTVEFLGIWESVFNPGFNYGEFAIIKSQAGLNSYKISVKEWVEKTNAIGLKATAGRYGGTFAHPDIAFEFGMWISPEFKIYLVKEFRRLKEDENRRLSLAWNLNRTLSKLNHRIHTDAIKARLIPPEVTPAQAAITYASEADVLNVALFGQTAKQWRDANPKLAGNMRDHATIEQLLVLAKHRGHECRVHPHEPGARRTAQAAESNCHPPDADPHRAYGGAAAWPAERGKAVNRFSIPTGLQQSAQGCSARATLGNDPENIHNPERVAAPRAARLMQPRWGCDPLGCLPRVVAPCLSGSDRWADGCNPFGIGRVDGHLKTMGAVWK
jgi:hypothetical protein